jgi:predicted DNA-binding transcriptional regulator YafY
MTNTTPGVKASTITLNEALLRLAILHDLEVEFRYAKGSGSVIETRHLKPAKIENSRDGYLRFVGVDPDREAPRGFRVDRIKGRVTLV